MTGRTEDGTVPFSLAVALATDTHTGTSRLATPASTLETDMHLVPEQMARDHLESRSGGGAWRLRRVARALRRAEAAERRARHAREEAVVAVRESADLVSH